MKKKLGLMLVLTAICTLLFSVSAMAAPTPIRKTLYLDSNYTRELFIEYSSTATGNEINATIVAPDSTKPDYYQKVYAGEVVIPPTLKEGSVTYSLNEIDKQAFKDCTKITRVVMQSSDTYDGVVRIGEEAFSGCSALTEVKFGDKLWTIKKSAFEHCDLRTLTLPKDVYYMEDNCFAHNKNLTDVFFDFKNISYVGNNMFAFGANKVTIHHRAECTTLYHAEFKKYNLQCRHDALTCHPAVKATATVDGNIEYYSCPCGKLFLDKDAKKETTAEAVKRSLKSLLQIPKTIQNAGSPVKTTLSKTRYTSTGKALKPKVTVYYNGKKLSAKYYTLKYSSNKNPGLATVKITGKSSYKGKINETRQFLIMPGKVAIKTPVVKKGYIQAKWSKISGVTRYEVMAADNKKFTNAKVMTVAPNKTSLKVTGVTAKKKYYVKVRAIKEINGVEVEGAWSAVKNKVAK